MGMSRLATPIVPVLFQKQGCSKPWGNDTVTKGGEILIYLSLSTLW